MEFCLSEPGDTVGHLAVPDFDTNVLHTNHYREGANATEYLTIGGTDTLVNRSRAAFMPSISLLYVGHCTVL